MCGSFRVLKDLRGAQGLGFGFRVLGFRVSVLGTVQGLMPYLCQWAVRVAGQKDFLHGFVLLEQLCAENPECSRAVLNLDHEAISPKLQI